MLSENCQKKRINKNIFSGRNAIIFHFFSGKHRAIFSIERWKSTAAECLPFSPLPTTFVASQNNIFLNVEEMEENLSEITIKFLRVSYGVFFRGHNKIETVSHKSTRWIVMVVYYFLTWKIHLCLFE